MATNDGGPAFPQVRTQYEVDHDTKEDVQYVYSVGGMTLRDYFASAALTGLVNDFPDLNLEMHDVARLSYLAADAMLSAREAGK